MQHDQDLACQVPKSTRDAPRWLGTSHECWESNHSGSQTKFCARRVSGNGNIVTPWCTKSILLLDPMLPKAQEECWRREEEFATVHASLRRTRTNLILKARWSSLVLAKISIGIITHQRRTDLKQMRWQKELQSGHSDGCGGATQWNAIGTCETYRNSLDQWTTPQVKKRFGVPCNGPIKSFGATISHRPISQKDKQRLDQFGNSGPRQIYGIRFACWRMVRRLAHRRLGRLGEKTSPQKSTSREIQVPRSTSHHGSWKYILPCDDGSPQQEGYVVSRPLRHRQLQKEDDDAGGQSDADDQPTSTLSVMNKLEAILTQMTHC